MHSTEEIMTTDGIPLYVQHWKPDTDDIKATIILVHGIAEHMGRYAHVADRLVASSYAVSGMDLRGHGKSGGQPRAYVDDFHIFAEDVEFLRQHVMTNGSSQPLVILGHSMGGLIGVLYALKYQEQLKALVTSGAALALGDSISKAAIVVGKFLAKVMPKFPVEKLSADTISRDQAVIDAYKADPLVYRDKVRARMGLGIINAGEYALERVKTLQIPLLIMHGAQDQATSPESSRLFYEQAGSEDKTLKMYEGLYHEIFNEPEQDDVLNDVVEWLNRHV